MSTGVPSVASSTRRLVDAPIRLGVEVLGLEDLEHLVERVALEQDGREHRRLGVEVVRRAPGPTRTAEGELRKRVHGSVDLHLANSLER